MLPVQYHHILNLHMAYEVMGSDYFLFLFVPAYYLMHMWPKSSFNLLRDLDPLESLTEPIVGEGYAYKVKSQHFKYPSKYFLSSIKYSINIIRFILRVYFSYHCFKTSQFKTTFKKKKRERMESSNLIFHFKNWVIYYHITRLLGVQNNFSTLHCEKWAKVLRLKNIWLYGDLLHRHFILVFVYEM